MAAELTDERTVTGMDCSPISQPHPPRSDHGDVVAASIAAVGGVRGDSVVAHSLGEPNPVIAQVASRQEREAAFHQLLSPSATRGIGAGTRTIPEEPDPVRTCFERDRDRIKHAVQFRVLAGKTQVFMHAAAVDERLRTRLTHSLEVSQIAVAICQRLGLNWSLAEAIAIGHDCGHGPLGHASEEALSPNLPGGFDHAVFGADVALSHLNLTHEVLDGIRNHSWRRPTPQTPEGEVVSWADRLAYVCHDFADAAHSGLVAVDDLPREVVQLVGTSQSEQLRHLIGGLVESTTRTGVISLSRDLADVLTEFRQFNYDHIYHSPTATAAWDGAVSLLTDVMDHVLDSGDDEVSMVEHVARVAAMTDRQVFDVAVRECGWSPQDLPRSL